jgi:hypothetical protein
MKRSDLNGKLPKSMEAEGSGGEWRGVEGSGGEWRVTDVLRGEESGDYPEEACHKSGRSQ